MAADRAYAANGLNQYTSAGPAAFTYDANGNLTGDGTTSYVYDAENRLVSATGGTTLSYDPLGRLWKTSSTAQGVTQFVYEGDHVAVEYDGSHAIRRRFAWGPGADEPLLQDEGGALDCSGTHFLHPDQQGSIVAYANCAGGLLGVNSYDDYGIPGASNWGRFQYTGQAWIADLGMYYYKARFYSPTLGRFMQTDPVGYEGGMNLYGYVGSDPINLIDPNGLCGLGMVVDGPDGSTELSRAGGRCPDNSFLKLGVQGKADGTCRGWACKPDTRKTETQQKESKPCDAGWDQFGERLAETGEFIENAGLAIAGVGAVTGVGAAGGLFVAAIGDVIQLGGHGIRFLAGNGDALGDAAISLIPGPKAVVPKSLRNEAGDVASDIAYEKGADAARPGNTGC